MKLAANLSLLFEEHPFLDRFEAAAAAGFTGVEFLFPYEHPAEEIGARLEANGLTPVLFNLPPGDLAAGDRGMAAVPGREREFAASVEQALTYAQAIGCRRLHAMAGVLPPGAGLGAASACYLANLRAAAGKVAPSGITLLIEPINTRDMPGYFLGEVAAARRFIEAVGRPNLRLQLDLYHRQIMRGDLAACIRANLDITAHIQIAGTPGRHEPDVGEVNYPYLFELLDELGYAGWVSCEYRPRAGTLEGLGWAAPYGVGGG